MSYRDGLILTAFYVVAFAWANAWPETVPGASLWRWEYVAELIGALILIWDVERQADAITTQP